MPKLINKKKSSKKRKARFISAPGISYKNQETLFYEGVIRNALDDVSSSYGFKHIDPEYIEDSKIYEKYYRDRKDKLKLFKVVLNTKNNFVMRAGMLQGILRAYYNDVSLRRTQPSKIWYFGNIFGGFSDKKSQKTEAGAVLIGGSDMVYDVQPIILANRLVKKLKIKDYSLKIGSTGCKVCKKSFLKKIRSYYKSNSRNICKKCSDEYKKNPLSLSKCLDKCEDNEKLPRLPVVLDSLCASCKKDLTSMLDVLEELNMQYILDPHMVYDDIWAKTVFKIIDNNGVKILEGGKMDNLVSSISKSRLNMTGFKVDIERLSKILKNNKLFEKKEIKESKVFVVNIGDNAKIKALNLIEMFYEKNIFAKGLFNDSSLKSRIDLAKKSGAKVVLIMGQKEIYDEVVIMRDIETSVQEVVPVGSIVKKIKKRV